MILSGEKKEEYREYKPYWIKRLSKWPYESNIIEFRNGYGLNVPTMQIEIKNIIYGKGKEKWGAISNHQYLVIQLGKILKTKNCK